MTEQPYIDQLLERIRSCADREAFNWRGKPVTYAEFDAIISNWTERLKAEGIGEGDCVGVLADYSPQAVGLAFALMRARAIFVPFSEAVEPEMGPLMELGGVQYLFRFDKDDASSLEQEDGIVGHGYVKHVIGGAEGPWVGLAQRITLIGLNNTVAVKIFIEGVFSASQAHAADQNGTPPIGMICIVIEYPYVGDLWLEVHVIDVGVVGIGQPL